MVMMALLGQQPASSSTSSASLSYDVFKTKVQPIFAAKRGNHARCITCHTRSSGFRLQPLSPGATTWTEEQTQKNFEAAKRMVTPGNPKSRLLIHPLAEAAGGDFFHNGGKHWKSQSEPEWQTLKAWVMGEAKSSQ
jgi:hypothetical protein